AAELAMHFERGRDFSRAVKYHQQAGENALQRYAHQEAIGHFTRGLAVLNLLPETSTHVQQELGLQIALSAPLIMTEGYGSLAAEKALTRARELALQGGYVHQLFPVLVGVYGYRLAQGQLRGALELAEECLKLTESRQERALLVEAHQILGLA